MVLDWLLREAGMKYTVLNPQGLREIIKRTPLSPRLPNLEGKTIYFIAQDRPVFSEEVARHLSSALPTSRVVFKTKRTWISQDDPELRNDILSNADAMIYGTCMGGGSGMSAVTWIKEIEKHGIPSVYLVGDIFQSDIKSSALMRGMPALRTVIVTLVGEENVTQDITNEQFAEMVSRLIDALTLPLTEEEKDSGDIVAVKPDRVAMTGTLAEIQDYFCDHGWTDGLPIQPATEEQVNEMLRGTSHNPDEVVTTTMYPEELTVTVEKAAIVGVMAGCKPEYMPLLLAIIHTWGQNPLFAQAARSDSTFSVMTVVNGPIRKQLAMNAGGNALGPGNRANATIGRFLRLAIFSLGGSVARMNDMSTQGSPVKYGFCFPEYEEKSPWEPFHVSMGYKPEESVVSLFSGAWCHWSFLADLDLLAQAISGFHWQKQGVILLAPDAAQLYSSKGLSKAAVEKYIQEHADFPPVEEKMNWFRYDGFIRRGDVRPRTPMVGSPKVIVVGGEAVQPTAQVWSFSLPLMASVDRWR